MEIQFLILRQYFFKKVTNQIFQIFYYFIYILVVYNSDYEIVKRTKKYQEPKPVKNRKIFSNNVEYGLPLEKGIY